MTTTTTNNENVLFHRIFNARIKRIERGIEQPKPDENFARDQTFITIEPLDDFITFKPFSITIKDIQDRVFDSYAMALLNDITFKLDLKLMEPDNE